MMFQALYTDEPVSVNALCCKNESFKNFTTYKFVNLPKYSYL